MPPLPHVLAGAAVIIGGVSLYEFVFKKKTVAPGDVVPAQGAVADAAQAVTSAASSAVNAVTGAASQVAAAVTGKPAPPTPGTPVPGRVAGFDPKFLAAHPGWHKGDKLRKKPKAPGLRGLPRSPTGAAIVNGAPVMTGDVAADLAHIINFHGYHKSDMGLVKRFQASVGLPVDGMPGIATITALQAALTQKGIALPQIATFAFKDASSTPPSWLT